MPHDPNKPSHPNCRHDRPPTHRSYDVVVVGGRAAGASTAMLLARAGVSVLVVDRASYGSDTLSSHALMRSGVEQLRRWGLLDRVAAVTPAIHQTVFEFGGTPSVASTADAVSDRPLFAPRRTVLDPILVDAAIEAGAEFRFGTRFVELVRDENEHVGGVKLESSDGSVSTVRCGLVVGADGLRSLVARSVGAPITRTGQHHMSSIYAYVIDAQLSHDEYRFAYNEQRVAGAIPTTGDVHCVFVSIAPKDLRPFLALSVSTALERVLQQVSPHIADGVRVGTIVGPVRTFPGHPGQFRGAHGNGWALVGDAGYFKDPAAAHGISDAFRDAELLADAIVADDLAGYEAFRNEVSLPLFNQIDELARLDWDAAGAKRLLSGFGRTMQAESEVLERRFATGHRRSAPATQRLVGLEQR